jgi:hypothetical protein
LAPFPQWHAGRAATKIAAAKRDPRKETGFNGAGGNVEDEAMDMEKFSLLEIAELRGELIRAGLDARDAAAAMQSFLACRGYGVSLEAARAAAFTVEGSGCSLEVMQRELERIAMVQ